MSELIVRSIKPSEEGKVLSISPQSANWKYVGFEKYTLQKGRILKQATNHEEVCIVFLTGRADVQTNHESWDNVGERMNIFEKTPAYSVYIPSNDSFEITAVTNVELAVCKAPGKDTYKARLISPKDIGVEVRGRGTMERLIHNILPEEKEADSLLVVEVFTPDGHWSSYPPHKHDENNLPEESYLEETYYHRLNPENGFAIQRVYTDDLELNETLTIHNGDAVLVPKGYHPVSAPPGYESYYLNVMAGPVRTWKFHNDPNHEWLIEKQLKK